MIHTFSEVQLLTQVISIYMAHTTVTHTGTPVRYIVYLICKHTLHCVVIVVIMYT